MASTISVPIVSFSGGHGSRRPPAEAKPVANDTVRKDARAAIPEAMLHGRWQVRTSDLDRYRPYLEQRIAEGCTNRSILHRELQERGARCAYSTLRAHVHPLRPGRRPAVNRRRRPGRLRLAKPPAGS
ncbi:hypothetical protein [Streptomyces sp. NPDC057939]|uniref:hypothetical protein n=1 Tax=Streptomyces sp. NPDC057939 TaxID=3346284 RepID=UPI0036E06466